jgi:hypothetical protein
MADLTTVYIRIEHVGGLIRTYERPYEDVRDRLMGISNKFTITEDSTPDDCIRELRKCGREEFDLVFNNPVGRVWAHNIRKFEHGINVYEF